MPEVIHEQLAMKMAGHKTRSVFERYNVTSGADLADAAKKLNAAAKALEHSLGTTASETSNPANTEPASSSSKEMPGTGVEPVRPLRGSGF